MAPSMNHETEITFPTPPTTYAASGLTVLSAAAGAVSEDVRCFLPLAFDQKEDDSSRRFVVSAAYYGRVLIQQTFISFYNITPVPAGLTDRLERTRVELVNMDARLCELEVSVLHWTLPWPQLQAGDLVPTAGPYQLLHQLMLERIDVATTLATVGEKAMMRMPFPVISYQSYANTIQARFGNVPSSPSPTLSASPAPLLTPTDALQ
ncbi:hypothetical protein QBC46DRAFT_347942 [Diplogelasinospora grovesii]|uniref:Uncharacterized protein n=1 Tax=Diplogelasinospora grovesii TaxID=303347 RepID=A0AAN6MW38_9PEZI|nr:hypothetical protein QBC46DRAFT_347942 [Diplogelasinospora grovesii]